jgi:hypothetical protein
MTTIDPIGALFAKRHSASLATSALPGAPTVPERRPLLPPRWRLARAR